MLAKLVYNIIKQLWRFNYEKHYEIYDLSIASIFGWLLLIGCISS